MRKGVREKTEVPVKILVNSTRETNILARENIYKIVREKSKVCVKKLHWSRKIILLYSISYGLPNNILSLGWESWEKIQNWGKNEISPRETRFLPVKKTKRVPVKKKEGVKKTEKSVRENIVLPVKKPKNAKKNGFHGHFWVSRGKKNTDAHALEKFQKKDEFTRSEILTPRAPEPQDPKLP